MRGKRGMQNIRAGDERDIGKKIAGETSARTAASRDSQLEEFSAPRMSSRGARAGKSTRRPRKSDI